MSFTEYISGGIGRLKAANRESIKYPGNDLGAVVGFSAPSESTQTLIGDAAAYVFGPALGVIDYLTGEEPFKGETTAPAQETPVVKPVSEVKVRAFKRTYVPPRGSKLRPRGQEGGFKMTTEKVTVTTTTAPKGGGKQFNRTKHKNIPTPRGLGSFNQKGGGSYANRTVGGQHRTPNGTNYTRSNNRKLAKARGWKDGFTGKIRSTRAQTGVVSGASAYSARPKGNDVWFMGVAGKPGCLRIKCKIFIGTLQIGVTTGNTIFTPVSGLSNIAGQWYYAPTSYCYFNNGIIPRMAQYFDSYYQNGAVMEYCTLLNTSGNAYNVTWCFCDAPDHWARLGLATAVTTPTKPQITYMSNSQTFGAWLPQMFIGLPPDRKKYVTTTPWDPTTGIVDFTSLPISDIRSCIAGTLGMHVDGPIPSATTSVGDIFLHLDITLCDMSGLQTSFPLFSQQKTERKMLLKYIDETLERKVSKRSSSVKSESRGDFKNISLKSDKDIKRVTDVIVDDYKRNLDSERRIKEDPKNRTRSVSPSVRSADRGLGKISPEYDYVNTREFDSTLGYPGEGPPKIDPSLKAKHVPVTDIKNWKDFGSQWLFPHHSGKMVEEGDMICVNGNEFYTQLIDLTQDPDLQPIDRKEILGLMNKIVADADADFYMYPDDWDYIKRSLALRHSEWVLVAHNVLSFCAGLIEVLEYYDLPSDCVSVYNDLKQYYNGRQLFSSYSHCIVKNCQYHGRLHQSNEPTKCKLFLAQQAASKVNSSS